MRNEVKTSPLSAKKSTGDMVRGDLAIIRQSPLAEHIGKVIMRIYNNTWVDLSDGNTWSSNPQFTVDVLRPGESVTLTVKS